MVRDGCVRFFISVWVERREIDWIVGVERTGKGGGGGEGVVLMHVCGYCYCHEIRTRRRTFSILVVTQKCNSRGNRMDPGAVPGIPPRNLESTSLA